MKRLRFSQKIILIASLVIMLVFAGFCAVNDVRLRDDSLQRIESGTRNLAGSMAHDIQSWLDGRMMLIKGVAEFLERDPSPAGLLEVLRSPVLMDHFVASYVGTAAGAFLIYPPREMPADYDSRQRPWYKDALEHGAVMTEPYVGVGIDYRIISQAVPIRAGQQVLGVLGVNLSIENIAKTLNSQDFEGNGYAFLVNRQGKILVHPDKTLIGKTLTDLFLGQAPPLSDQLTEVSSADGEKLSLFVPIKGLASQDWYVGIALDKPAALASLSAFRNSAIIATVIAVLISLILLGLALRLLMKPLRQIGHAMDDVAEGEADLTRRLAIVSHDEFGQLASGFNRFVDRLHASISDVAASANALKQATGSVLGASNSSVAKARSQAGYTTSVAAAIEELGATAQDIAGSASAASREASAARQQVQTSCALVDDTVRAMRSLQDNIALTRTQIEELNERSANIGTVLEVISTISGKTNLLALNAAIEAARAGEAGRGFAVVADEVRSLAHHTQTATEEIRGVIEALQQGATQAAQTMLTSHEIGQRSANVASQAGASLQAVVLRIGEIDDMNLSVAAATEEQSTAVDQLNRDVHEINQLNQQSAANLDDTLQACARLDAEAGRLHAIVDTFKL
ncbi:methyl-accepting chemotaxis protein [Pseudomonas sp. 21LCFQ010]|uniref:methyl-accepting chemotaxis protein n=1 Tax=Pseudomonas sp. 21LCFQ010 TaxID=2957506 RepID=UPI0020981FF0|nr:methyl-accepting chemotaxis protein [Pseudomonas sp. 21LCFQ010]MCO8162629.1 methyl-accepting chemotaxis protein [Pseudomonas sp. 21LCFQ010]